MSLKEKQEIKYLRKISGISSLTIKGVDFFELDKQEGEKSLLSFYTNKFKPSNQDLWELATKKTILKEIVELFNKKVKSLSSKKNQDYYYLTKFNFGVLVKNNNVSNQKIISRYNTIPIYLIPTLVKLSFDTQNINKEESLNSWKEKIIKNEPTIEFIIADKPFIPQELFDYNLDDDSEDKGKKDFYFPIFDINEADKYQSLMLKYFKDSKDTRFPLDEKDDNNIKNTDYLETLELKEVNNDNLKEIFSLMQKHLTGELEKKNNILIKNNYELKINKTLFSVSEKEVDVLYKAYCLIDDSITKQSVNIENKLASEFFSKDDKKTLIKNEEENIFFNSENHYGSFNINIVSDNDLISLALNQRIVLNTTSEKVFKDGDVLAVNGPPGTGKTTVLQSIISNMITENIFDFIENKEKKGFIWNTTSTIKTPKSLNVGCSFTQQAVKNILNSLNFDKPKYNKEEIDLIWNKRWIYYQNKNIELGYVLDLSKTNENKNKLKFFLDSVDEISDFFIEKYQQVFSENQNIEESLKEELLSVKKSLDLFKLSSFKNCFYLNELTNQYEIKSKYVLSETYLEEEIKNNLIQINDINEVLNKKELLLNQNNESLNELRNELLSYQNKLKNLKLKDYKNISFKPIELFVKNYYELINTKNLLIEINNNLKGRFYLKIDDDKLKNIIAEKKLIKQEVEKLEEELNIIENNYHAKDDDVNTFKNNLDNIKKSLLSKFKIKILGKDNKIDLIEKNIKTLKNELKTLKLKKEKNNKYLIEKKNEEEKLENELLNYINVLEENSLKELKEKEVAIKLEENKIIELLNEEILLINNEYVEKESLITNIEYNQKLILTEKNNLLKDKDKFIETNKKIKENIDEIKLGKEEVNVILKIIKNNLKQTYFEEFFYAKESITNLILKIENNNINLLNLYNELNIILDNTLRYKCFQLSMRLKEWYFIKITKELSNLEEKSAYQAFNAKLKTFKNTTELYELNYFSLIFPLIISTLHSLGRKVSLYQNKGTITLPGKIDNVIVDESGQISVEIGYIAAWNAKRLLCVGDTDQIKPVFSVEKKLDYFISQKYGRITKDLALEYYGTNKDNLGQVNCCEASLMNIAQKLTKYHQYKHLELSRGLYLVEHRRCPDEIINYCNEIIYKGILIPKKGSFKGVLEKESEIIKKNINKPWEFIKVNGIVESNKNEAEAIAIYNYIENLIINSDGKYSWKNIGKDLAILSPFRNQANLILDIIKNKTKNKYDFQFGSNRLRINKGEDCDDDLIIGTVHALQGAEKKIILFSFVSNDLSSNSMIIKEKSILNVAISRSKLNIVLFGSEKVYFNQSKELETIRKYLLDKNSKIEIVTNFTEGLIDKLI